MTKLDGLLIGIVCILFLSLLSSFHPEVFSYRFSTGLVQKYFLSQDIPHEVPDKRLFLSDSDIHIAAGYLYATGKSPTAYNFQHMPFIKYLYGYSIVFFGNPFYVQIMFAIALIALTYLFSLSIFRNSIAAFLGSAFLVIDPLLMNVSSQALLDLGQAVFALALVYTFIFHPKRHILHGILLGLFAASKFWAPVLFFITFLGVYTILTKRKVHLLTYVSSFVIAGLVFILVYAKVFMDNGGLLYLIKFAKYQLMILRYWFQQSTSSFPGASLIMFLTGYFQEWWGTHEIARSNVWSILWPATFVASAVAVVKVQRTHAAMVIYLLPILYLLYLGVQAPFPRYYLMVLPYLYIGLGHFISSWRWRR